MVKSTAEILVEGLDLIFIIVFSESQQFPPRASTHGNSGEEKLSNKRQKPRA